MKITCYSYLLILSTLSLYFIVLLLLSFGHPSLLEQICGCHWLILTMRKVIAESTVILELPSARNTFEHENEKNYIAIYPRALEPHWNLKMMQE